MGKAVAVRPMPAHAARLERFARHDRKFFARFPSRRHRVRVANADEIAVFEEFAGGMSAPMAADRQIFVAVRHWGGDLLAVFLIVGPRDADTDMPEDRAKAIFDIAAHGEAR